MIKQKLFDQMDASSSLRRRTVCSRKQKEQGEFGLCNLNSEFIDLFVWQRQQVSAISIQFAMIRFVISKR